MQTIIVNKVIIGAMALFVMMGFNSLWFNNDNINAKIYNYNNGKFYGELIVRDRKLPLIVSVDTDVNNGSNNEKTYNENKEYTEYKENIDKKEINDNKLYNEQKDHNISNNINKKEEIINKDDINKRENINKKEEKFNENIKITDDYTPGSIDIVIENNVNKIKINRDMGSKEMSDVDKELCIEIVRGTMNHVKTLSVPEKKRMTSIFKGFLEHINRPKESKIKWFKW